MVRTAQLVVQRFPGSCHPTMWLRHWNLSGNPFDERRDLFVTTPTHGEAVARFVHTIESAGRSVQLVADPGMGKSLVLSKALELTRHPGRRFARAVGPSNGAELFARLAVELGAKLALDAPGAAAWRALTDSIRLCRWQGLHVVLAVDDCQEMANDRDRRDLERLDHLDSDPSTRLTILKVWRPTGETAEIGRNHATLDWNLAVRLDPLTCSETADYLAAKLNASGLPDPIFTPRAITRLHIRSGGIPRGIDRLAGLALMASALRGLEVIPAEIIEAASLEYVRHEWTLPKP